MNRKLPSLILSVLTLIAVTAVFLLPLSAAATEREHKPAPRPAGITSSSTSSATANAAPIDLSLMNNPVAGDTTVRGGNTYSLVSGATPLPPGLCPKGESVSVIWGLFAWSKTATEHECLDKVLAYAREAIPKPPVTNYITNNHYAAPEVAPVVCEKPPARKASAPKKAAPACKPA